jgi:hypothetical protein
MSRPSCFGDLPAEIVLNIVNHLIALPHEQEDLILRDAPTCPCWEPSENPADPPVVLQYGRGIGRVERYRDKTMALSMINCRTRDIVFGERLKRGLRLGLCEDVLTDTRQVPVSYRSRIR